MNNQQIEQYRKILADAPEGATHYSEDATFPYKKCGEEDDYFWNDCNQNWGVVKNIIFYTQSLSDIQAIVDQYDENQALKARVAELEQKIFQENALVMANARRLIKAKMRTSNARLFMELFGTGFGTATSFCRKLGLDPSSNETNYTLMMEHLHQQAKGE